MKLFVGNLPFNATEEDIRSAFEAHGEVSDVAVIMDRETGRPRGFAFVEMPDSAQGNAAIEALNNSDFGGRSMNVNEARPREDRPRGGGGGGGGGFRGGGGGDDAFSLPRLENLGGGFRDRQLEVVPVAVHVILVVPNQQLVVIRLGDLFLDDREVADRASVLNVPEERLLGHALQQDLGAHVLQADDLQRAACVDVAMEG